MPIFNFMYSALKKLHKKCVFLWGLKSTRKLLCRHKKDFFHCKWWWAFASRLVTWISDVPLLLGRLMAVLSVLSKVSQQVRRWSFPHCLVWWGCTWSTVPSSGSPVQWRDSRTGKSPTQGHQGGQEPGAPLLRGEAGRALGLFSLGKRRLLGSYPCL